MFCTQFGFDNWNELSATVGVPIIEGRLYTSVPQIYHWPTTDLPYVDLRWPFFDLVARGPAGSPSDKILKANATQK